MQDEEIRTSCVRNINCYTNIVWIKNLFKVSSAASTAVVIDGGSYKCIAKIEMCQQAATKAAYFEEKMHL